jgi:hypothetical protein
MSLEMVMRELKRLNRDELFSFPPKDHAKHMMEEGDRAAIILFASSIEGTLLYMLKESMPTLNSDEKDRIFNFEGPCGSFSNRIRLAQGLGLIDRQTRKHIELIKEMRNVAAHSYSRVTFDTPAN